MRPLPALVVTCLVAQLAAAACFGGSGKPEGSVERFVSAINDVDFNDAYEEFIPDCREEMSLAEFQDAYGIILLAAGVGRGGSFGGTSLKAEDLVVTRVGDRDAEITLDWVLYSSIESPLPFLGTIADERVPLETVLDVAGTADRPLYVLDVTGSGDWRLENCDPLGLTAYYEDVQDAYEEFEYYYSQLDD